MMENRYYKVEGYPNIVRDSKTNAIINTDTMEMQSYISSKNKRLHDRQKLQSMEDDINSLKSSIDEIKQLLKNLTNGS